MTHYTQDQYDSAIIITNAEYNELSEQYEPIFEGQTKVNKDRQYKIYWTINDKLYVTINKL